MLQLYDGVFGRAMWRNTIVVVTHWCFDARSERKRKVTNVSLMGRKQEISEAMKRTLGLDIEIPIVFMDNFDAREDDPEPELVEQLQHLKAFIDKSPSFDLRYI